MLLSKKACLISFAQSLRHWRLWGCIVFIAVGLVQALAGCGHPQAKTESMKPCIAIQQTSPEIVSVDDSGNTTEPIRITVAARGESEDLKGGRVIYTEDDLQIKAIPVGDLHTGVQNVTIAPGLHVTSSSELFEMVLRQPDGKEGPSLNFPLNSRYSAPPVEARPPAPSVSDSSGDSDQPIATIAPGVDRQEAESIRQFGASEVGITSWDGFIKKTSDEDANSPPQTLTLRGVNFKDGMLVRFRTLKGGQRVEATSPLAHTATVATLVKPSDYIPNNPSALMSAVVVVPVRITHAAKSQYSVLTAHAESSDSCK